MYLDRKAHRQQEILLSLHYAEEVAYFLDALERTLMAGEGDFKTPLKMRQLLLI